MLEALWLYPPLAFARLGTSDEPLEAFYWGPNDESLEGTGKTTITPARSLVVGADGAVETRHPAARLRFRDADGLKPVCPFFELHGRWRSEDKTASEVQVTEALLASMGKKVSDLRWKVEVANLKPYFMTRDEDTRIDASVLMSGDEFGEKPLLGRSPAHAMQPLVPFDRHIPLGVVQLIRPDEAHPGLRLRFRPPKGDIYGPPNLKTREFDGEAYDIPERFLILNAGSSWAKWTPPREDPRGLPGFQFAADKNFVSLGLVDDTCDGIITCGLAGTELVARARVAVAPPHYAPDRRHLISIADGLKDRVGREEVHSDSYFSETETARRVTADAAGQLGEQKISRREMARVEIHDLLERVLETMGLSNLDAFNDRVGVHQNPFSAVTSGEALAAGERRAFDPPPGPDDHLPLVEAARQSHRRLSSLEIFENLLRQRPSLIPERIREPVDPSPYFDKRMPALMQGSSGEPLHLTRRQYDLLVAWARILRASTKDGS